MPRQRCRVKICGVTSVEDALMIAHAGADAIGLVFYPGSRRYVSLEQAVLIRQSLPPFISCVGLFLDASAQTVKDTLQQVSLDLLQFHGAESPEFCQQFARPYIKGLGMAGFGLSADLGTDQDDDAPFHALTAPYEQAAGFLVDSHAPGAAGGTGQTFDWTQLPKTPKKPLILAGGLRPDNAEQALKTPAVFALDVSSGVEQAPGVKSPEKVRAFMQAVKQSEHVTL